MLLCAGLLYYVYYIDSAVDFECDGDGDSHNDEDAPPGGASWFGEVPSRSTWHPLCFGTGAIDDVVDNAVDDEVDVVDDVLDDVVDYSSPMPPMMWWMM